MFELSLTSANILCRCKKEGRKYFHMPVEEKKKVLKKYNIKDRGVGLWQCNNCKKFMWSN